MSQELSPLEHRIADILMLNVDEFEAWNVLRYEKGQHYYAHHDYFDPELFNEYKQNPWTQRHYTLLVYLSEPEDGGETVFPWEGRYRDQDPGFQFESCDFGVRVRPKKGDAVFFESLYPDHSLDKHSLHAGCPVSKGTKWVATKWIRVGQYP